MTDDKTEAATPRKRKKAREEGQVARSAELVSCAILLLVLNVVPRLAPSVARRVTDYFGRMAGEAIPVVTMTPDHLLSLTGSCFTLAGGIVGPLLLMAMAGALAVNVAQVGFG